MRLEREEAYPLRLPRGSLRQPHRRPSRQDRGETHFLRRIRPAGNNLPTVEISGKPDLKEAAREMLIQHQKMGEFKDRKWLEETTDLTMGGDIRFALTSRNVDFLKRLSWGGLTISEFREVQYRIRELESQKVQNPNVLSGKLIDVNRKFRVEDKKDFTPPQFNTKA